MRVLTLIVSLLSYLRHTLIILFLISSIQAFSWIKIPEVIGSHMVLQRNSEIKVWGWASKGEKVSVKAGWMPSEVSTFTGADGTWQVKILTGNAGGPYSLKISGSDTTINLEDILLGEVWICSGQSNMEFTIRMFGGWNKTYPSERDELLKLGPVPIRLFTLEKDTAFAEKETCKGNWQLADTATVASFSATAWFYGLELYKKLGIPVGLIVTAWGGTAAEAWTPSRIIENDPDLSYYRSDPNRNEWFPSFPSMLFNAMIHPLLKTTIKGAIWYQGESNVNDADTYDELFSAMIRGWREEWGLGNFPFYYVQIAPFTYEKAVVGAMLRESQLKCMSIPNTGMVVTMDITGDVTDIHPKDKVTVGKRLAEWALHGTYGVLDNQTSGPVLKSFEKEGKGIRLIFDHAGQGLEIRDNKQETGFVISGSDRHFVPAKISIRDHSIFVSSDYVNDPVAVRYAYTNISEATLFNHEGLPASTFRTDVWPLITDMVFMHPEYDEINHQIKYNLLTTRPDAEIYYSLDGTEPTCVSRKYQGDGILILRTARINARVCVNGFASETIGSWVVNPHKGIASDVTYLNTYASKFSAGGAYGLVDGIQGTLAFNDGTWQGFEGDDLSITLDLGESTLIRKVSVNFLSDTNSWVFFPKHVEIKTSQNGITYDTGYRFDNFYDLSGKFDRAVGKEIETVRAGFMKKARFIKILARNIGQCPPGHPGAGGKAWVFVDEVVVE
jgi:sialate O-acetylesterase